MTFAGKMKDILIKIPPLLHSIFNEKNWKAFDKGMAEFSSGLSDFGKAMSDSNYQINKHYTKSDRMAKRQAVKDSKNLTKIWSDNKTDTPLWSGNHKPIWGKK